VGKNLILVAGYPKSGSTWVRLVFETLRRGRAVSINDLDGGHYGARRRMLFDAAAPVNAGDLLAEEIDDLLPGVFRALSEESSGPHVIKVHDCALRTRSGDWLYPPDCVQKVLYLTRHPFDVAVSYAHHLGISPGDAIGHMGTDETVARSAIRLRLPLHERIGSWSGNIGSWLDGSGYDVVPLRYEDLFENPVANFVRLAHAAGFTASEAAVARACEATRFDRLKNEEQSAGFLERPKSSPAFFRAGRPRSWQGALDADLQAKLMEEHGAMMARLGYDAEGNASAAPQWRAIA